MRALSIDVAIMERTKRAAVIVDDFGWSDVGSWSALWSLRAHDRNGNVLHGDTVVEDVKDSLIDSEDRLTAVVGLDNVIVVSTEDALLVANKARAQSIAPVVAHLKKDRRPEVSEHRVVARPWGSYRSIIGGAGFQVKEIIVNPGGRLSLQMHEKRAEHWIVVAGTAHVTCDDAIFDLHAGENTFIPLGAKHRLENFEQEALRLIEVQCGSYLGEDDIVRFEDIYGRADRES
jgi:mannose-1-phosphate guanylyltransferase/mannose-6-phosphate isomerase